MKLSSIIFTASIFASAGAFISPLQNNGRAAAPASSSSTKLGVGMMTGGLVDVTNELAQRDVYSMEEWATQYGTQKADGVELYTADGSDYQLITQSPISAGQTALYVPSDIVLNSVLIQQELGSGLQQAEEVLCQIESTAQRLPLFRLMAKVLVEYEKGQDSMFYPWLNSLPRQFYNGVAMTDACFACLPPYAAMLAMNERNAYSRFLNALRLGYVPLQESTLNNDQVVKWAFNVALTRFHEVWLPERAKLIAPMADMLNHSSEPNCEITFDGQGNCNVQALYDIQPGYPLTISLGDPTNPTPLFAQYGFLYDDCKTIFCKAVHLEPQIEELGYDYKDLLIQTESGEIAPKVWDIFLYEILRNNDPGSADEFFVACKGNDEATKQQYHDNYRPYTLDSLKNHVYSIMQAVEELTAKAQSYDLATHPRVPVIVAHNQLVSQTFGMTANLLEQMG